MTRGPLGPKEGTYFGTPHSKEPESETAVIPVVEFVHVLLSKE